MSGSTASTFNEEAQRRSRPGSTSYSKFNHNIPQHKQSCDKCHTFPAKNWKQARKGDEAFPDLTDYPEHASCIGCHRQQFFRGSRPAICTICHVNPGPNNSARHPFPNPTEVFDASKKGQSFVSQFGINFPHDKHIEIVGRLSDFKPGLSGFRFMFASFRPGGASSSQESEPKSCAVCHQTYQPQGESDEEYVTKPPKDLAEDAFWLKKGTFKTSPASHTACFTCHSEDSGLAPAPKDCNTCHKLLSPAAQLNLSAAHNDFDPKLAASMGITDKTTLEKWSRRDSAKYRHEWLPHAGLSCNSCHNVTAMNTLDEATKKVPVRSCGGEGSGCHIEATPDGVLNMEIQKKQADQNFNCTKCHVLNGSKPAPDSHLSALPKK